MGLLRLEKRQNCASGYQWYVCSNGAGFRGCCSMDPCTDGVCPAESQGINLDTVSTAPSTTSPIAQTTIRTTTRTTTTEPTTTEPTTTTPPPTTPTTSPRTTASATPSTTATTSPPATTSTTLTGAILPTTSTVTGSNVIVVETAGGRTTTITLNGDSTATVTGSSPSSTVIADTTGPTKSGNKMGAIIGGAVGGVLFLILLAVAFFLIHRRRRGGHNVSPPYGPVTKRPSGIAGFFAGIFPKKSAHDSNVNSMASPSSPNPEKTGFFGLGFFKRRNNNVDHFHDDPKLPDTPGSPPPPPGFMEMPVPSFAPPHQNADLPYNMVELESDIVSAPSELSTQLYHTTSSAWSPTPELQSEVSGSSSTGAVLSPMRETHYSETSTTGGSTVGSQMQGSRSQTPTPVQQNSSLRGGGWPGMRPNLNSLRRKPNLARASGSGSVSGSGSGSGLVPQDPNRHVLSWMEYDRDPGSSGHGGIIR